MGGGMGCPERGPRRVETWLGRRAAPAGRARALVAPAPLKGAVSAVEAAAALAEGFRRAGVAVDGLPLADGGEGSLDALAAVGGATWRSARVSDAFGRPRDARWLLRADGTAAIEAAEAIPLDPCRREAVAASSRGLGELLLEALATRPAALVVCLGGTATVDGGAGLLEVVAELPVPTTVACDVDVPLLDAARVFAAQKGADAADVAVLERRLSSMSVLAPYADVPGAGAAGGLGAALAALGAELVRGAAYVCDAVAFDARPYALVVTGEGTVDRTTRRGKAPAEVARRCALAGVRCVVFGGRVAEPLPDVESVELSGSPSRACADLVALGERLAGGLAAELLGE